MVNSKVRCSGTMTGMRKIEKPSPTESPLLFEVDPQPAEEMLTALGGLPLVVQGFRFLGLPGSVKQHVVVKERQWGDDACSTAVVNSSTLGSSRSSSSNNSSPVRNWPGSPSPLP